MTKNFIEELQNYYELKDNDEFKLQDKHGAIFGANSIFTFHNEVLRCTGHSGQRQEGFVGLLRGKLTPVRVKTISEDSLQNAAERALTALTNRLEVMDAETSSGGNNMSKNYIEQFMQDNGLEEKQVFKLDSYEESYYFCDNNLYRKGVDILTTKRDDNVLFMLLQGRVTVAKEPPNPWTLEEIIKGERYEHLDFAGENNYSIYSPTCAYDRAMVESGLAFKTKQDALDNIDKFKEFWGDQWEGKNNGYANY